MKIAYVLLGFGNAANKLFLAIFNRLSNITDYFEHQWDLKLDQLLIVIQQWIYHLLCYMKINIVLLRTF